MKSGEEASDFDWVENLQRKQGLRAGVGLRGCRSDVFLKSLLGASSVWKINKDLIQHRLTVSRRAISTISDCW